MPTKTDNHNPAAKLALRRQLLSELPRRTPLSVCDCFSGAETLWTALAREFRVTEYLALDVKPKRARLKLDSLRYLQGGGWDHNVIDLDAYGSPWRHYFEVVRRGRPCTVFLTIGNASFAIQQKEGLARLGVTFDVPKGLHRAIAPLVAEQCLGAFHEHGLACESAWEAPNPGGTARYIGLRLGRAA